MRREAAEDRPFPVGKFFGRDIGDRGRSACQCEDRQRRQNTNTSATCLWSIATQAVDWRQRFASNGRVASRGLHYHASTRNVPMTAGGRSDSCNDTSGQIKIEAEQRHAHQGLGRPGLVVPFVYYSPWLNGVVPSL